MIWWAAGIVLLNVVAGLWCRHDEDYAATVVFTLFWPITVPVLIVCMTLVLIIALVKRH